MTKTLCALLLLFTSMALEAGIGYGTSASVNMDTVPPSLTIIAPSAGDIGYVGGTFDILWNASDPNLLSESVTIWYSLDGGSSYLPLAEGVVNDGIHTWSLPAAPTQSARIRIRVTDSFGFFTRVSSPAFVISYVPPAQPQNLRVDISNGMDALLTWDAVTATIPPFNQPITPDGYIVLYSEIADAPDQYFFFLGETDQLEYTHQRVAHFREHMFYKVLAYMDLNGRMADLLTALSRQERISLRDLKAALSQAAEEDK